MHEPSRVVYPEMPLEQLEYFNPVEAYRRRLQLDQFSGAKDDIAGKLNNNNYSKGNMNIADHLNRSPTDNNNNNNNKFISSHEQISGFMHTPTTTNNYGNAMHDRQVGNNNNIQSNTTKLNNMQMENATASEKDAPISTQLPHLANHYNGISPVSIRSDVLPSSMTSLHHSRSIDGVRRNSHDLMSNDVSPPPLNPSAIVLHDIHAENKPIHNIKNYNQEQQRNEEEKHKMSMTGTPVLGHDGLHNTDISSQTPIMKHVTADHNKSPNKDVNVYTIERYPYVCANDKTMHHLEENTNDDDQHKTLYSDTDELLMHQNVIDITQPTRNKDQRSVHELSPSAVQQLSHASTPSNNRDEYHHHHAMLPIQTHLSSEVQSISSRASSHKSFTSNHSRALMNEYVESTGTPMNVIARLQKSGEVMRRERESHQRLREIQRRQADEASKAEEKEKQKKNSKHSVDEKSLQSDKERIGVFDRLYAHAQQHNREREEREKRAEERRQRERALLPNEINNVKDDCHDISHVVVHAADNTNTEEEIRDEAAKVGADGLCISKNNNNNNNISISANGNEEIKYTVDANFFERLAKPVRVTKKYVIAQEDEKNERNYALQLEREKQKAELERFASFRWQLPAKSYTLADLDCQNALLFTQC